MGEDHPRMFHASNFRFDGENVPVTRRDIKTCWSSPPKHIYPLQSPSLPFFPFYDQKNTRHSGCFYIPVSEIINNASKYRRVGVARASAHGVNIKSMPELRNLGLLFEAKRNQTKDWGCVVPVGDVVSLQFGLSGKVCHETPARRAWLCFPTF
ncbi:hypothetical protein L207DRAFT_139708 [Hyaloscypha variabilis F]|uniref:Uncharacterized protein n=1 Tax=Hyaloscypha variabilis (strain UAMH 11265 / GT02V1 / F) TaxID=1149755 RepID=A0A2J6R771_HYAVF|nr:hypothetical protein L207DRAFT_139708 [Hyaloscypha variabilis F]